jgi:hypothetical protein
MVQESCVEIGMKTAEHCLAPGFSNNELKRIKTGIFPSSFVSYGPVFT